MPSLLNCTLITIISFSGFIDLHCWHQWKTKFGFQCCANWFLFSPWIFCFHYRHPVGFTFQIFALTVACIKFVIEFSLSSYNLTQILNHAPVRFQFLATSHGYSGSILNHMVLCFWSHIYCINNLFCPLFLLAWYSTSLTGFHYTHYPWLLHDVLYIHYQTMFLYKTIFGNRYSYSIPT